MFTRSELEIKTIQELRDLCRRYGIKPTGNAGYKTSFITSLMAFPYLALQQMKEHRGLKPLGFANFQSFASGLDEIGIPTDEQSALIRITMEGRKMSYPERYEQSQLMNLYKAKLLLEQVIDLLNQ
ncbi:hypothetical protein [Dendronalium sp. ChiSLP03b]|uniref:hypothetical protein n=1 Tax=Dendronalium sp. ChiSLP03b TaxID=3075381 RepID=UPI002AD5A8D7|nr:hypothetical protein [Dendronalium sp. ChiSLP03b]MDZ8207688.1 hypothetical protein [Dendronalium sp. ChiSLP03b]